jgi:hypothetical protein
MVKGFQGAQSPKRERKKEMETERERGRGKERERESLLFVLFHKDCLYMGKEMTF